MLSQLALLPVFAEPEQKAGIGSDGAHAAAQAHTRPFPDTPVGFTAPDASAAAASAPLPAKVRIPAH